MDYINCACGCGRIFPKTRKDRYYFEKKCRNRVSNYIRDEQAHWLKQQLPLAQEQDARLMKMIHNEEDITIIQEQHFGRHGIRLEHAIAIYKRPDGVIDTIRFNEFELIRLENNQFTIRKIKT